MNQILPIITTTIDPRVYDRVATCGGTHRALTTPTMKGFITDVARSSAPILRTPGNVVWTVRDGTTPHDFDVAVKSFRDNGPVLIGRIVVLPIMAHSGRLNILNKRQSTSASVSHRRELPVLRYHGIRVNYRYPFLGVNVSVILHDVISQNYHKNQSDCNPFPS